MKQQQPLISNFLGNNQANKTLEKDPPKAWLQKELFIEPSDDKERNLYRVMAPAGIKGPLTGGAWAILELYVDNEGGRWINHIETAPQARRAGLCTRLVEQAKKDYGAIYASNSQKDPGGASDTRHLSNEGAALVASLIKRKIMEPGWYKDPIV